MRAVKAHARLQARGPLQSRSTRGHPCPVPPRLAAAACARSSLSPFDDEYDFSLSQYMVVLDKPIGLTLAPDPLTGQVRHVRMLA